MRNHACDKCQSPRYIDKAKLQTDVSADGAELESFEDTAKVPCNIVSVGGVETYKGRQLVPHVSHVIETPYRKGLKATQRLVGVGGIYDQTVFNIKVVRPMRKPGARPVLELYCTEVAAT